MKALHKTSNRLTLLAVAMVLFSTALFGQSSMRPTVAVEQSGNDLLISLDFSHLSAAQWLKLLNDPSLIHETGYGLLGEPGSVALPIFTELIPVETSSQPQIHVLEVDSYSVDVSALKMTPPGHREADPPIETQSMEWPATTQYSQISCELGPTTAMMGRRYLPLTITPLALNLRQRQVELPRVISLRVSGITPMTSPGFDVNEAFRSMIPNNDIYEKLGHYLIITPPTFAPYIEYLGDWKRRKGHPVTIVTTNEAGQTPSAVKAFIQNAYDTWDLPPEYVLLIGDEDAGIGGFYVYNPDNEALVTDHPYVLLDGEDSFPEAWVGRLSVDTISELSTVISKILSYESDPYMDDSGWFQRALMVCTVSAAVSTQHVNNWIGRKLTENGFTQIDTAYYPMQTSLFFIRNPIDEGVGFVNYRGLGAWDHWIGPYFYNSDIDQLHNGFMLPILTSIVCGGGNFAAPTDPVFGEKWLRAGSSSVPKGAVAFIGPSEVHTHTQFNNVIDVALYSALFDLGMNELGPALWYAKLELWKNYYQSEFLPFGQSAEFYQNVYNILGDPGMAVWTDVPKLLVVDFPPVIQSDEDHVTVTVLDTEGAPVAEAFVFLKNSDNAVGLHTDESGSVILPFQSGDDSELLLTVTGKNLKPILESMSILESTNPVSISNWVVGSDDQLEAGESHSLALTITNNSEMLSGLTLVLSSSSDHCSVSDSTVTIETIAANTALNLESLFDLEISNACEHGKIADLKLQSIIDGDTLIWRHTYPIQAPKLAISELIVDGEVNAGDSLSIQLVLENQGGLICPPTTLRFLDQTMVSGSGSVIDCPSILVDETQTLDRYDIQLSDQLFPGEMLVLAFESTREGRVDTLYGSLRVEALNRFAPSLPDDYGYRIYDDLDVSYSVAPDYEWIEIDPNLGGNGARLPLQDTYEEDDATRYVELPFTVSYYGEMFDHATICSNGWLALGASPEVSFYNRNIPSATGPNAMIAPYWDDLITVPGGVSIRGDDDQFIVEWSMMSNLEVSSTLNFQVIIYNTENFPTATGDNLIKMQFKDYFNYDTFANFSTTGIEAPGYMTGLQAGFNNLTDPSIGSLHSGQALLFTTERAQRYEAPQISLSQFSLNFSENPWSVNVDSIVISNTGGSSLVYQIEPVDPVESEQAPNPVAGFPFMKGGPEPVGSSLAAVNRDLFDYEWIQNGEIGGPDFSWHDISLPQYELEFPGDPDDSSLGPFQLGFAFPFFSENYDQFFFSSNGSISFTSNAYPWANLPLPNGAAPPAMIAPWWDDLNNNDGVQGVPYYWTNEVDTAIITWDDFPKFGTNDRHTFQLIMISNGDILLQYLEMEGVATSATVGIQNAGKNKGLQVCYNSDNDIQNGRAILIHRQAGWMTVNKWTDIIDPGESSSFKVTVDTRYLDAGNYSVPLSLSSNAENLSNTPIQINLDVIFGAHPPGDVNGDYQINIIDLVSIIDLAIGLEEPTVEQFMRADLDVDGELTILDVIQCLELILQ